MELVSWNVNGVRSIYKKNFLKWFLQTNADLVCMQEVKCHPEQVAEEEFLHPGGFHSFWHPAEKPGYSGLVVYSRTEPLAVTAGLGLPEFDSEGRVLSLEFKDFTLVNAYFPNSQREHTRLPYKLRFCAAIFAHLEALRAQGKNVLICGDFNIAHKEIDLKNPKSNQNNAGFLPQERAWLDDFIKSGYTDTFRQFEPGPGHYTWWSYRPGVREKNIGWRLDYFFSNQEFSDRLQSAAHLSTVMGSDHCPVFLKLRN